ncbi:hypothetical protein E8E12_010870 [Didymella heteroderae]|uniref:NmrA-like domain-containing protein n=1 Tax=Didymella heteroderae TaxID=1769908 RepID=A0A9P4WXZ1_9PLEO|nr:hypothetical protein E8E12_010870 [Didymella heteroderae]
MSKRSVTSSPVEEHHEAKKAKIEIIAPKPIDQKPQQDLADVTESIDEQTPQEVIADNKNGKQKEDEYPIGRFTESIQHEYRIYKSSYDQGKAPSTKAENGVPATEKDIPLEVEYENWFKKKHSEKAANKAANKAAKKVAKETEKAISKAAKNAEKKTKQATNGGKKICKKKADETKKSPGKMNETAGVKKPPRFTNDSKNGLTKEQQEFAAANAQAFLNQLKAEEEIKAGSLFPPEGEHCLLLFVNSISFNMSPSFLIIGATGNTGRGVVEILSKTLDCSQAFSKYRILAQTRSADSPTARELAKLPHVEIIELNWTEITAEFLREHQVARAFIASHNQPNQFAEESTFHVAALRARVEYVVRISTTASNVRPDCDAYYPRTHWAIETMLESPAFEKLHWTSLQPNVFSTLVLSPAAEMIKRVRDGEDPGTLRLFASADAPVGIIDPYDVSRVAAKLLLMEDISRHNKAKYSLNGPADVNGEQIVAMVEKQIGAKVRDVRFEDVTFLDEMIAATTESKNVIASIKRASEAAWAGRCTAASTSKAVLELAPPKRTPADVLAKLLQ